MPTRRMITLRDESWLFQYRVAAIALRDDRVLLCLDNATGYWYMPGGRVELAEPSETALAREMSEELNAAVQIERLVWVVENFWGPHPDRVHELCLYYLVSLPESSVSSTAEKFTIEESDGQRNTFRWWSFEELVGARVYPSFLRTALRELPMGVQHIIHHDADG
ncbi:MAG: NUDIX domain-containing protein [Candidatus Binataceae bacterium]